MNLRKEISEITYEVTVRGKERNQVYDCVLRNFFEDEVCGADLAIRKNLPLPGGLMHASKERILEKLYDDVRIEAYCYGKKAEQCADGKEKEMYLAYVQALESLDYGKLNKVFRRE
jgi:hypothetical protein